MGGDGQPQTQAAVFTRHVTFRQPLDNALDAPRWLLGRTWGSSHTNLRMESRFDGNLIDRLMSAGHDVAVLDEAYSDTMGHAGAVVLHPDGTLEGGHDPRADGGAAGRPIDGHPVARHLCAALHVMLPWHDPRRPYCSSEPCFRGAGTRAPACLGDDAHRLVYAADGSVTGVRHAWAFDDMFSAFATQGIESKEKGKFSREELAPLAKVNVESLKEYAYFTYVTADGKEAPLTDPAPGYWLDYKDAHPDAAFHLPLKTPVKPKLLRVEVYDPTFFVDLRFAERDAGEARRRAGGCQLDVVLPTDITDHAITKAREDHFNSLNPHADWGAQFADKFW